MICAAGCPRRRLSSWGRTGRIKREMGGLGGLVRRRRRRSVGLRERFLLAATPILAAAAVAGFALAPGASQAAYPASCNAPAGDYNPVVMITFSGNYTDSYVFPPAGDASGYQKYTSSLTWNVSVVGTIWGTTQAGCYPTPDSTTLSVTAGSVSATPASGSSSPACSASISVAPGEANVSWGLGDGSTSSPNNNPLSPDATEWGSAVYGSTGGLAANDPQQGGIPLPLQTSDPTDYACNHFNPLPPYFANGGTDPNFQSDSAPSFSTPYIFDNIGGGLEPNGQIIGPTSQTWAFSDENKAVGGGTDSSSGSDTLSYSIVGTCQANDAADPLAASIPTGVTDPSAQAAQADAHIDDLLDNKRHVEAKTLTVATGESGRTDPNQTADGACLKLEILDEGTGKPANGEESIVGREMYLKAVAVDDAGQLLSIPAEDVHWTMPGARSDTDPKVVLSYAHDGRLPDLLATSELGKQTIAFAWAGRAGPTETVSVSGTVLGVEETATATLTIERPDVSVVATTCRVGVDRHLGRGPLRPPLLGLGLNDELPCKTKPGIKWHIEVSGPPGQFAMTQLVDSGRYEIRSSTGTLLHTENETGGRVALDNWPFYARSHLDVPGTSDPQDSPAVALNWLPYTVTVTDIRFFSDYFMYRPDSAGIWVTLGTMYWSYSGSATGKDRLWELTSHTDPPLHPTFDRDTSFPEWQKTVYNSGGRPPALFY